jgi:hypothetical protein
LEERESRGNKIRMEGEKLRKVEMIFLDNGQISGVQSTRKGEENLPPVHFRSIAERGKIRPASKP